MNAKWTKPWSERVRNLGAALATLSPSDETKALRAMTSALHYTVVAEAERSCIAVIEAIREQKAVGLTTAGRVIHEDLQIALDRVEGMIKFNVPDRVPQ